jgi:glyceraldehyde 3-phosphate dehydrogenase
MATRIAINGFGRIGRCILRAGWNNPDIEFVHINDLTSDEMLAYLLQNDTVHGTFSEEVEAVEGGIRVGDTVIPTSAERNPADLPWAERNVDIVLECTGVFRSKAKASAHLEAGAGKVIISAPGTDVDGTFVYGVNHTEYDPSFTVISNASCTTNCLAPLVKVLDETVGLEHGLMTTIHSYTMDQNILDAPHPKDFRRARAAAQNIVPTSTGAAKATALVLPHMSGRLDGMAVRVPTPNGSLVDLVFTAGRDTTVEEINGALKAAADGPLAGVLQFRTDPVVSSDIVGNSHSSIIDADITSVIGGRQVKVLSWYDNEWGFSNRMLDLARYVGNAS